MSNTSNSAIIEQITQDIILENYISYPMLAVVAYDIGQLVDCSFLLCLNNFK